MPGTRTSFESHDCGFAQAVEAIGDQWCLLLIRNLFMGMTRFEDFAAHLPISSKILADRLQRLRDHGLVETKPDPLDKRGKIYQLTDKGDDLGPLVASFTQWGDKWVPKDGGPRTEIFDRRSGEPIIVAPVGVTTGRVLAREDIGQRTGPGGSKVRDQLDALVAKREAAS